MFMFNKKKEIKESLTVDIADLTNLRNYLQYLLF